MSNIVLGHLAISQFSFPVTFNGLAMLYKSLSVWAEALKL